MGKWRFCDAPAGGLDRRGVDRYCAAPLGVREIRRPYAPLVGYPLVAARISGRGDIFWRLGFRIGGSHCAASPINLVSRRRDCPRRYAISAALECYAKWAPSRPFFTAALRFCCAIWRCLPAPNSFRGGHSSAAAYGAPPGVARHLAHAGHGVVSRAAAGVSGRSFVTGGAPSSHPRQTRWARSSVRWRFRHFQPYSTRSGTLIVTALRQVRKPSFSSEW